MFGWLDLGYPATTASEVLSARLKCTNMIKAGNVLIVVA